MLHANYVRSLEFKKLDAMREMLRKCATRGSPTRYATDYELMVDILNGEVVARLSSDPDPPQRKFVLRSTHYTHFADLIRAGYGFDYERRLVVW